MLCFVVNYYLRSSSCSLRASFSLSRLVSLSLLTTPGAIFNLSTCKHKHTTTTNNNNVYFLGFFYVYFQFLNLLFFYLQALNLPCNTTNHFCNFCLNFMNLHLLSDTDINVMDDNFSGFGAQMTNNIATSQSLILRHSIKR